MNKPDRSEHSPTVVARFAVWSRRARVASALGALGTYGLVFFFLYRRLGLSVTTAAILPVVVAAWLWGARAGLLSGLLGTFLNTALANLAGRPGWDAVIGTPGGAMGAVSLVLIGGVIGRMSDLSQQARQTLATRQQAEEMLERLMRQNELLLRSAGEGIYGLDLQGRTTFVNPAAAKMLGYEVEELMGQPMHDTLHHSKPDGSSYPREECPIYAAFRDGATHRVADEVFWKKDGTSFPVAYVSTPIRERNELVGAVVVFEDTTERDRVAVELVKLRQAAETSGEVIFLTDREGILTYVNPEFTRLYGHASEEVVGKVTPRILKSGRMKPEDYEWFWQTLLNKQVVKGELVNKTKDGRFITIEASANPILDEDGGIIGFLAIQRDITERKQTEEALHEERQLFIGGTIVVFKWKAAAGWPVEYVSPNVEKQFGYRPEELTAEDFKYAAIVHPDDRARVAEEVNAYTQAGVPCFEQEYRIVRADGEYRWVYDFTVPVRDERGEIRRYHGYALDITERKRMEEERERLLQETHQRAEELEALARVSSVLRRAQTREEMLPVLAEKAAQLVGGIAGAIFLVEPTSGDLVARSWYKPGTTPVIGEAGGILRHRPGEGISGHVAATGEIYVTQDLQRDPLSRVLPGEVEFLGAVRSQISLPLRAQEQIIGVMHIGLGEQHTFTEDEVRLLTAIADMAANALHRATLHEQTERDAVELALAYDATIEGWSKALELRDKETEGHTQRVTEMSQRLARVMRINEAELVNMRRGALLHDIGKMGVPDGILHKPSPLTDEEWVAMKKHPTFAYEMLAPITYLHAALDIPYCHHEKWDGTGYPRGLKGEQIPLTARIFAVVDVYDALTSDRPYRKAWTQKKTLEYIREQSGTHFDPAVVAAFLASMPAAPQKKTT